MRIATWNVNSIRARVARVTDYLQRADIDILAMQEIKCKPEQFPRAEFEALGYELIIHGLNQWNGVAFAYKKQIEVTHIEYEFSQMPEFKNVFEARALGATFDGIRLWSLYVPNGRELHDPHYSYKLQWLHALAATTAEQLEAEPDLQMALIGDFNIAPLDTDVWDIAEFAGSTHVSEDERMAFDAFEQIGLTDVVRTEHPEGFTYWDYKQLRFPKNEGMRIDFILATEALANRISETEIVRDERKGDLPSDHVPVVAKID